MSSSDYTLAFDHCRALQPGELWRVSLKLLGSKSLVIRYYDSSTALQSLIDSQTDQRKVISIDLYRLATAKEPPTADDSKHGAD